MTVVVVTGNSQGVGLAISRELLSTHPDTQIIGLSRNHESTGLKELTEEFKGRIVSLPCDISDPVAVERTIESIKKLSFVKDNSNGIDMLINNAGSFAGEFDSPVESSLNDVKACMATNLYGTISVTQGLIPLLRNGKEKKIMIISALGGSFGGPMSNVSAGSAFCISKAALNMWSKKLSLDLYEENFIVGILFPGFVSTQIGGSITPDESAKGLVALSYALTRKENGKFFQYDGTALPW